MFGNVDGSPQSGCSSSAFPQETARPASVADVFYAFFKPTMSYERTVYEHDGSSAVDGAELEAVTVDVRAVDGQGRDATFCVEFRTTHAKLPLAPFGRVSDEVVAARAFVRASAFEGSRDLAIDDTEDLGRLHEDVPLCLESLAVRALMSGGRTTVDVLSWRAGLGSVVAPSSVDLGFVSLVRGAVVPVDLERWMACSVGAHARAALFFSGSYRERARAILDEPPHLLGSLVRVTSAAAAWAPDERSWILAALWLRAKRAAFAQDDHDFPIAFEPFERSDGFARNLDGDGVAVASRAVVGALARAYCAAAADGRWRLPTAVGSAT